MSTIILRIYRFKKAILFEDIIIYHETLEVEGKDTFQLAKKVLNKIIHNLINVYTLLLHIFTYQNASKNLFLSKI